ncbi:unnamed protein product [Durusdinium trenchii]|uniref:SP-RING-type domain-containing protein n=1 Tax=Durusdinium trenchii TaxID=1381693 RepID=A0ABP0RCN8_9DINO
MVGKNRRTKFFAQRQQLPWPAPATALVACILFPCTVALRALQACISSGIISGGTPLPPVTFPWIAWPVLMMGALWFRHLEGAWFTSAAVTGRAIAAAALLGVLDGCSSSLDFFVTQGCGNTANRQGVILAVVRAADIPLAAGLSAALIAYRVQVSYFATVSSAVLFSLPTALGLASASILASFGEEAATPLMPPTRLCGDNLLFAAVGAAALCRAFRCAAGAFLLQQAGVENSLGGLFFVGGFSGFFGSMLVLPMMLGQSHLALKPWSPWSPDMWSPWTESESMRLDFAVMTAAVLFLGTADTVSRLAVLRHSDAITAASLDAGLMPLATLMAHSTGSTLADRGLWVPTESLALVVLLFSFLVQHQLAQHSRSQLDEKPLHQTSNADWLAHMPEAGAPNIIKLPVMPFVEYRQLLDTIRSSSVRAYNWARPMPSAKHFSSTSKFPCALFLATRQGSRSERADADRKHEIHGSRPSGKISRSSVEGQGQPDVLGRPSGISIFVGDRRVLVKKPDEEHFEARSRKFMAVGETGRCGLTDNEQNRQIRSLPGRSTYKGFGFQIFVPIVRDEEVVEQVVKLQPPLEDRMKLDMERVRLWVMEHRPDRVSKKDTLRCVEPPVLKLTDCTSLLRIEQAARGSACEHLQCFDLNSYIHTMRNIPPKHAWCCPICDKPAPIHQLRLDAFAQSVIDSTASNVTEVLVADNGKFEAVLFVLFTALRRRSKMPCIQQVSATEDDLQDSSDEEALKAEQAAQAAATTTPAAPRVAAPQLSQAPKGTLTASPASPPEQPPTAKENHKPKERKRPPEKPKPPPPEEKPEPEETRIGWLPDGASCSLCSKSVVEKGGVYCGRKRAPKDFGGCFEAICWKCMNKQRDKIGKIKTTKNEFSTLGPDAWWMHEKCMKPEAPSE